MNTNRISQTIKGIGLSLSLLLGFMLLSSTAAQAQNRNWNNGQQDRYERNRRDNDRDRNRDRRNNRWNRSYNNDYNNGYYNNVYRRRYNENYLRNYYPSNRRSTGFRIVIGGGNRYRRGW